MDRMILYTPEVLYAVIAYYNAQMFPAQLVAAALALVAMGAVLSGRPVAGRMAAVVCGAFWIWCGLTWLGTHYQTINWAGFYYAIVFAVQGVLLVLGAIFIRRPSAAAPVASAGNARMRGAGVALALYALALHPLIEWMIGKSWAQAQYVSGSPDATVVFTLGLLAAAGRTPFWLMVIPVLWLLLSGAWSLLLGAPDRLILPVLGLAFVALLALIRTRRPAMA